MTEREQLKQAITQLEAQRATLGDGVVDASIAALREHASSGASLGKTVIKAVMLCKGEALADS